MSNPKAVDCLKYPNPNPNPNPNPHPNQVSNPKAVDCLKYMLLSKIMMNSPEEVCR